jgi:predicted nucleic acid-binding protein
MNGAKGLVLDDGILLSAVVSPGPVLPLLMKYENTVRFCTPDVCFLNVRNYLAQRLGRQGLNPSEAFETLNGLERIIEPIDVDLYETSGPPARARLADPRHWPVIAVSLLFDYPIWTNNEDFFGTGVAAWKTDKVELYLQQSS